jgi:glycosyltransferase involved in cell wall biosynthesis
MSSPVISDCGDAIDANRSMPRADASAGDAPPLPRPKLLFVGAFPPPGSAAFGGNLSDCRALLESSFARRVELVLLDSSSGTEHVALWRRVARAGARTFRFVQLVHREKPDAVLAFAASGLSFVEKSLQAAYARAAGIPALLSVRSGHFIDQSSRSPAFVSVARVLLRAPARVVCQGERWRALFRDRYGLPQDRCPIVDAWTASDELLRVGRERSHTARAPVTVLFLGAFERFKGVCELLDAAARLRADTAVPAFELVLGGQGSLDEELRRTVADRGLASVVKLAGLLSGAAKLEALRMADVFVLPSHTEGLPNALIEAMAAGLPAVVTPVGSVPDVIEHGKSGLFVTPRDVASLERELRRVIESPALRGELGAEAHRVAATRFGTERAAQHLERLVREAMEEFRSAV